MDERMNEWINEDVRINWPGGAHTHFERAYNEKNNSHKLSVSIYAIINFSGYREAAQLHNSQMRAMYGNENTFGRQDVSIIYLRQLSNQM